MEWTRRRVLGASGIAMGLAGCMGGADGGDGDGGSDGGDSAGNGGGDLSPESTPTESPTPTETQTTEPQTTTESGPTVQVHDHPDLGEILVGPDGMTLYMFDPDEQGAGASTCYDDCAEAWPPLTVDDEPSTGDDVTCELTTFEREDGSTQVAANGWPLYYFVQDEEPGDVEGQGVNDVWWVLRSDGTPVRPDSSSPTVGVRSHPDLGDILVGPDEMTLYMFDPDEQGAGASTCYDDCAEAWPPLTVEDEPMAGENVTAELTTFDREDGSMQVAANGWPLYYFVQDEEPGDVEGQGVNDVWWVLTPDGEPIRS